MIVIMCDFQILFQWKDVLVVSVKMQTCSASQCPDSVGM